MFLNRKTRTRTVKPQTSIMHSIVLSETESEIFRKLFRFSNRDFRIYAYEFQTNNRQY